MLARCSQSNRRKHLVAKNSTRQGGASSSICWRPSALLRPAFAATAVKSYTTLTKPQDFQGFGAPSWSIRDTLLTKQQGTSSASVTNDQIKRLASLGYLAPSAEQIDRLRGDVTNMLHFIEHIQQVDTNKVEPLMTVLENTTLKRREDQPKRPYPENVEPPLLKVATARNGSFYVVPKQKTSGGPVYEE